MKQATEEAAEDVTKVTGIVGKTVKPDEKQVDGIVNEPNPVTGYVYEPEADRKRSRLAEALIAAVIVGERPIFHKELQKFANLWHTQTLEYAEIVVDETRKKTFKKNGIRRVRWVSENDSRVCEECKKRNGRIYDLSAVPPKPHYRCRCWLMPLPNR